MRKGKIVNLELFYSCDSTDDLLELLQRRVFADIDIASKEGYDSLIALMMCDGFLYKNNEKFYNFLKTLDKKCREKNIKEVVLVPGMVSNYQEELEKRSIPFKIIPFDHTLDIVYQSYKNKDIPDWNYNSKKYLFLTGVPSRKNRIGLLYKMHEHKLLDRSIYSFFPPWTENDANICRSLLHFLNDNQYYETIEKLKNNIDDLYDQGKEYTTSNGKEIIEKKLHETEWFQDVSYINSKVFKNTCLSVISEGCVFPPGNDYNFLTEKTWRAVCNNHPFLFAGETAMYSYLKERGLRDISNYVKFSKYGNIEDENRRYDLLVKNIADFLDNFHKYKVNIIKDIDHNRQVFLRSVEKNYQTVEFLKRTYCLDDGEVAYWFFQKNFVPYTKVYIENKDSMTCTSINK